MVKKHVVRTEQQKWGLNPFIIFRLSEMKLLNLSVEKYGKKK
jgi:hypothetical protein